MPFTAGLMSSSGSSALKWNGLRESVSDLECRSAYVHLAVCATPCTPFTASSKAPSCSTQLHFLRSSHCMTYLCNIAHNDILERLAFEKVDEVLALLFRSNGPPDRMTSIEERLDSMPVLSATTRDRRG